MKSEKEIRKELKEVKKTVRIAKKMNYPTTLRLYLGRQFSLKWVLKNG